MRGVRIHVRHARPTMHLAQAVTGPDGTVLAGAGTTLFPAVVRALVGLGVQSVWVREAEAVRDWEEDKEPDRAVADLDARFDDEPDDPLLDALRQALRRRFLARTSSGDTAS